jgi:hypothetical protein
MNPIILYVAALALFGVGHLLIRNTSPFSRLNTIEYEKRRNRRIVGQIFWIAGAILLALAMLTQLVASFS